MLNHDSFYIIEKQELHYFDFITFLIHHSLHFIHTILVVNYIIKLFFFLAIKHQLDY